MDHLACPTAVVNASADEVWRLITQPQGWGEFFDVRITRVEPPGAASVGQIVYAKSGPRLLKFPLKFQFTRVETMDYRLGVEVRLPFGVAVSEDLICIPIDDDHCRVNYGCGFTFSPGWRGRVMKYLLHREVEAGPTDSLNRLAAAAERLHAHVKH